MTINKINFQVFTSIRYDETAPMAAGPHANTVVPGDSFYGVVSSQRQAT